MSLLLLGKTSVESQLTIDVLRERRIVRAMVSIVIGESSMRRMFTCFASCCMNYMWTRFN